MGRSRLTPEDILALGLPLEPAFQKYAPPRKLPDNRPPLATLIPPNRTEQAEAAEEVLLGLKVIRDTIYMHDEVMQNRWSRFRGQLNSGRLVAAGFVVPRAEGETPVLVPKDVWAYAQIDLSLSSLAAGETSYEGLRVIRAAQKKRGG